MMIDKEVLAALIEWHDARQAICDRSPMEASYGPWLRLANAEHALHKAAHDIVVAFSNDIAACQAINRDDVNWWKV